MTNTNINTAANSGKPEPTQPDHMARTLAPWLKALNTGEAISRQQAPKRLHRHHRRRGQVHHRCVAEIKAGTRPRFPYLSL